MINGQVRAIFVKCAKTLGEVVVVGEVGEVGNPSFYCLDWARVVRQKVTFWLKQDFTRVTFWLKQGLTTNSDIYMSNHSITNTLFISSKSKGL